MALSETYPQAPPAQSVESHVAKEQQLLGDTTTALLSYLGDLRSRLGTVLEDLPVATGAADQAPSEAPPYRVMAAQDIRDQRVCVERAVGIVTDILDRLRL